MAAVRFDGWTDTGLWADGGGVLGRGRDLVGHRRGRIGSGEGNGEGVRGGSPPPRDRRMTPADEFLEPTPGLLGVDAETAAVGRVRPRLPMPHFDECVALGDAETTNVEPGEPLEIPGESRAPRGRSAVKRTPVSWNRTDSMSASCGARRTSRIPEPRSSMTRRPSPFVAKVQTLYRYSLTVDLPSRVPS